MTPEDCPMCGSYDIDQEYDDQSGITYNVCKECGYEWND